MVRSREMERGRLPERMIMIPRSIAQKLAFVSLYDSMNGEWDLLVVCNHGVMGIKSWRWMRSSEKNTH